MMAVTWKNYGLRGDDANDATSPTRDGFGDKVEQGWCSCPVDRKALKSLMKRADGPALA